MSNLQIEEKLFNIENSIQKLSLAVRAILSAEEAAEFLSMKTSYLYKLTSARKISHSKPNGKLIYFRRSVLEDYLLSNEIPAICEEQQSNENHWKK